MLNKYFQTPDNFDESEFRFRESQIIEAIQMNGLEFLYISRNSVDTDILLGEDNQTIFESGTIIEARLENLHEFDGNATMFMPFGLIQQDEISIEMSKRRFSEEVKNKDRPQIGDLLYCPSLFRSLFEIISVSDNRKLTQFQQRAIYSISAIKFVNSSEEISSGFPEVDSDKLKTSEVDVVESDEFSDDSEYFSNLFKNK